MRKYLDKIYHDPSSGGGYTTPEKLLKEVQRRGQYKRLGLRRIKHFLDNRTDYSLYKPLVTKFPTPPVRVSRLNQQFDMDLMDVSRQQSDNDGVRYILTAIDILSKYAFMVPLKSKDGKTVAAAAKRIFEQRTPQVACTDFGSEFKDRHFHNVLNEMGIHHFYAQGSTKATVVERFHRTMRTKIARYQYHRNTDRYIDKLQDLLAGYNKSFHTSIKMRPVDVDRDTESIAYENLYYKHVLPQVIPFQFKVGDRVRISAVRHPFSREFYQRWSEEIFDVSKAYRVSNINLYKLIDCASEPIVGSFYAQELSRVTGDIKYRIDRTLEEKTMNGRKYSKVLWKHYPPACATWELKSTLPKRA